MYKIIGNDQKEYGPVTVDAIRQWIRENRANAATLVRFEGAADWRPLSSYPEFAGLLAPAFAPPPPALPTYAAAPLPYYYSRPRGNGLANTGLVFSLLGFLCCCFPLWPMLGIIFGGFGLTNALKNPERGGKGVAIVAIVLSVLEILFWLIYLLSAKAVYGPGINFSYSI